MIGWLHGQVLHHHKSGALVLDVHDVGYEVNVASLDDYAIGDVVGSTFSPRCATTRSSCTASRRTSTVSSSSCCWSSGVGPLRHCGTRTMTTDELAQAIESDDAKRIATIPGIGPKTASRIVLELKGKVFVSGAFVPVKGAPAQNDAIEDALRGLGYTTKRFVKPWAAPHSR